MVFCLLITAVFGKGNQFCSLIPNYVAKKLLVLAVLKKTNSVQTLNGTENNEFKPMAGFLSCLHMWSLKQSKK